MKKILYFLSVITCMVLVLLTGCSVFSKDVDFPDLTLKYGEELQLPTEVDTGIKSETVEYSFSGSSISIENGILRALVAETVTVVTAKYGSNEAQFKVTVLLGDANNDTPPAGDGGNTDGEIEDEGSTDDGGNTDDGNTPNKTDEEPSDCGAESRKEEPKNVCDRFHKNAS